MDTYDGIAEKTNFKYTLSNTKSLDVSKLFELSKSKC